LGTITGRNVVDFRDLAYFEVIADLGHMGRAAERLGRTQPALTKCVQRLETEVRAELFTRTARGLSLTRVGEVLLSRARRMRVEMEESLREVSEFAAGSSGLVRIGAGATMAEYLLPQVSRALVADAPDMRMELQIAMSGVLRRALRAGDLDLVLGPIIETDAEEFACETFGIDEVVVIAAREHPLCGRPVAMSELAAWRWVLPAPSVAMRQWLDRVFEAAGLAGPDVQIETNSITTLPRLIAKTDLLSFTSTRNLGPDRLGVRLERLDIEATTMRRPIGVVMRRDHYLSPAATRVLRLLRDNGRAFLEEGPLSEAASAAAVVLRDRDDRSARPSH
jgi:DNA-binding transcriptional LysR family regulator